MEHDPEAFPRHPNRIHGTPNEIAIRDQKWGIIGKSFDDYLKDFYLVDFKGQIPSRLAWLKSQDMPIIIDYMATTDGVRSMHDFLNKPYRALAISYSEAHEPITKYKYADHITGDLNKSATWTTSEEWLAGEKAHLIMGRPYAGLQHIPTYVHYYRAVTSQIWKMLHPDGGIFLVQIPSKSVLVKRHIPIDKWLSLLDFAQVDYQYLPTYESKDAHQDYGLFMAIKESHTPYLPDIFT